MAPTLTECGVAPLSMLRGLYVTVHVAAAILPNRPLPPRRGRFGTAWKQLECEIFERTAETLVVAREQRP